MTRVLLVAVVLLGGCRATRMDPPKKTDSIIFSHEFHANMDFDCDTCHKGVTEATDLAKSFLPTEATCLECHADQKTSGECGFCHTDPKRPASFDRKMLAANMPHARHRAPEIACATCHTQLSEPGKPAVVRADHDSCLSCHKKDYAVGSCETCHDDLARFAVAPIASFSHEGNFIATHGDHARTSAETCAKCHDQTTCSDCHAKTAATRIEVKFPEEVARSFIHRGDYVTRHALEARADSATCAKCHGTSFCDSCHTINNLTPQVAVARTPHPQGWSFPGSGDFHGTAARKDINSCASCHDQGAASNCVSCHRVGGLGGNPHPASWLSRHDSREIAGNGMCLACH